MRDKLKEVTTNVTQVVDSETGEVLDQSVKKIKVVTNSDDFALIYASIWDKIIGSDLSKSDLELFAFLVKNYSDGTPFSISNFIKQQVANKSNKSVTSYNKSTNSLLNANFIVRVKDSKRVYLINPRYVFKGSTKMRKKALIEILEDCKGC